MSDKLYSISVCNNLAVIAKKDYFIVAINATGIELYSLLALKQIEISTIGDINHITSVKSYPEGKFTADKRAANMRDLLEIQNAQLALELELTLEPMIRSFPLSEIADVFLPARILADALKHHADYDLPEIDFTSVAGSLIHHADYMIRTGLDSSGIQLPAHTFEVDATTAANKSIPAARLVLDWLQQVLEGFSGAISKMALSRAEELKAG